MIELKGAFQKADGHNRGFDALMEFPEYQRQLENCKQ